MRDIPYTTEELKQKMLRTIASSEDPNGCHEWSGCLHRTGYGVIQFKGVQYRAHRLAYELFRGLIPAGLLVCHKCDNPKCCRIDHLFLGTTRENSLDMVAKGRSPKHIGRVYPCGDSHWTRSKPERILRGGGHPRSKLTDHQVLEIRELRGKGLKLTDLSARYGVSTTHIKYIVYRKSWTHI
jgi:hypothetical protein